jgi:hypothetical protein
MPTDTIDHARALIQARLAELDAEAGQLRSALASLGEKQRKSGPRKTPVPAPRRKAAARAPRGKRREQLLAAIKDKPGARPSELAGEIGISANQVHALIAKARKDKLLVRRAKGYALKA